MIDSEETFELTDSSRRRQREILQRTLDEARRLRKSRQRNRYIASAAAILVFAGGLTLWRSSTNSQQPLVVDQLPNLSPISPGDSDRQSALVVHSRPVFKLTIIETEHGIVDRYSVPVGSTIMLERLSDDQLLASLAAQNMPHGLARAGNRVWLIDHRDRLQ